MTATRPPTRERADRVVAVGRGSLVGLVLVLVATPAVNAAYSGGWAVPVVGAALGAAAVNLAVRSVVDRGVGSTLVIVHLVGIVVWVTAAVRPAIDGATALGGVGDSVARLLTTLPPVDARGPELAVAVVATWVASATATALASRRGAGPATAAPAVLLFAAALLVGDPRRALPDRVPAGLTVAVGLALVVFALARSADRGGRASQRSTARPARPDGPGPRAVARGGAGLLVVAAATVLAMAAAPSVPGLAGRERVDVRADRDVPVEVGLDENPIDAVPALRRQGSETLRFTARVELPPGHDARLAWRVVLLDELGPDGWSQSPTSYVRAGSALGAPPADEARRRSRATVELDLAEPLGDTSAIPTLDRPTSVDPSGLAFDRADGVLAVPIGRDRPPRVSMDVALPVLTASDLATATVTRTDPDPSLPSSLTARVAQITGGATQPITVLSLLTSAIERDESLTLDTTQTGLTRTALVVDILEAGGRGEAATVNDAQLAAAFALLARAATLPVRLVVGYLTPVEDRRETLRVTDADLTVWPEVRLDGLGWVPFPLGPPAGGGGSASSPLEGAGEGVVDEAVDQETDAADRAERSSGGTPGAEVPPPPPPPPVEEADERSVVPVLVAGSLAAVVATALLVGPTGRWLRRRRRRRGEPAARVVGAWDELVDSLAEAGATVTSDRSRPEIRDVAASRLPDVDALEVAWVAAAADASVFGAVAIEATDVERAWAAAARVRRTSRRALGRPARVAATFRPPRRRRVAI